MKDWISVNPLRCRTTDPYSLGFEESAHCPKMLLICGIPDHEWGEREAFSQLPLGEMGGLLRVGWEWHSYTLLRRCFLQRWERGIAWEQARYLRRNSLCLFCLKKKKKNDKRVSALGSFSIFLILVPICNQDFGLPRRLDYYIHNSLAAHLVLIQWFLQSGRESWSFKNWFFTLE